MTETIVNGVIIVAAIFASVAVFGIVVFTFLWKTMK